MIKLLYFIICGCVIACIGMHLCWKCDADPSIAPKAPFTIPQLKSVVDIAYLPITPQALKEEIDANAGNEVQLVQLIREGYEQNEVQPMWDAVNALKQQDPHDPNILSAYCMAIKIAVGDFYLEPARHIKIAADVEVNTEAQIYSAALKEALLLDPHNWLALDMEGYYTMGGEGSVPQQEAIKLCEEAVKYHPNVSYARVQLDSACGVGYPIKHQIEYGLRQSLAALKDRPVVSDAALAIMSDCGVLDYNNFGFNHNSHRALAYQAKKALLQLRPGWKPVDSGSIYLFNEYP